MDAAVERLMEVLANVDARALHLAAREIGRRRAEPGDDLAWWEATMAVDHQLTADRRSVQAAAAARVVGEAVISAAQRAKVDVDHEDVRIVARRARLVARAVIAGPRVDHHCTYLLAGWWDLLTTPRSRGATSVA